MKRWPALLLILAIIAGLVFLERDATTAQDTVFGLTEQGPTAAAAGASGSTWYCPAGSVTPDATADHIVVISNHGDSMAEGTLTIFPSLTDTLGNPVPFDRAAQNVQIAAGGQQRISLAPIVTSLDQQLASNTGAFAAALVEFDGAGVTVEHVVTAAQGSDMGPCATSASTNWWFTSGTTTAGVGYQLYLLNPFADDAVVDISFVTDAGTREPTAFDGKLIPAQSLTVLQVAPVATVNEQMTAQVTTRTGRVIAERVQVFAGEAGASGLTTTLGSNRLSEQWFFPAGRSVPGVGESYLIYNPGDRPAEVEFEVKPDSADRRGDVAPRTVVVGGRERWVVTVNTHATHPANALASIDATTIVEPDEPFFVSVRSFNGVPVVAERLLSGPSERGGVTTSLGADVAATEQSVTLPPGVRDADAATLAVLNPAGDTISRVDILVSDGENETRVAQVELAPRRRAVFDLTTLVPDDAVWVRIVSTTGTVADLTVAAQGLLMSTSAIPVEGTISVPDLLSFE